MNLNKLICTLILISSLFACNQPQSNIDGVSALIEHAENSGEEMSESDVQKLGSSIEKLQKDLDENRAKYSDDQVKEVGKLKGRYAAIVAKKGLNNFKESVKDFGNQVEGFIEGITDSTNNKNQ